MTSGRADFSTISVVIFALLVGSHPALAQFTQQGSKLVGGDSTWGNQGESVSLSADGNTAIVGASSDNALTGAAWVWTRSGGTWTQQGPKLVGSGGLGGESQGESVSISADGNTAIVGAPFDNIYMGAAWIWTRTAGVWTQQGPKLYGSGAAGGATQGGSVAISADGNTAIIGGYTDANGMGAAWIWTRTAGVWTQQGQKLVGSGAAGYSSQGSSVALSADGNTAIVGGLGDNSGAGAAWIFVRNGATWTQQGPKLVGNNAVGKAGQGQSVFLSADGSTAIVGGVGDDSVAGAAWIFVRSGSAWRQEGSKLIGSDAAGKAGLGRSVSLSADGNTALIGGVHDNDYKGATWVFARSGGVWTQQGTKLVGSDAEGASWQGTSVALSADAKTALIGGPADDSLGAIWVFVAPSPCLVSCAPTVAPSSGQAPLNVVFSSNATTSGSCGSLTYEWSFGDGNSSSQQNPSHTYSTQGTYTWSLTAKTGGQSCSHEGTISVSSGGPKPGDCDGDGQVSIGEVQKAINMFLGTLSPGCGVDCNGDGTVSIGEVQKVINGFLGLQGSC